MCGRFTLTANAATLQESMGLGNVPDEVGGQYNVAPSQAVAVVTEPFERDVKLFRWGLIPSWAKDKKIGYRMINARAETVAQKPAFRAAFSRRRCVVLADGFYEWQRVGKKKKQLECVLLCFSVLADIRNLEAFLNFSLWIIFTKGMIANLLNS